jgi:hypothetical protein
MDANEEGPVRRVLTLLTVVGLAAGLVAAPAVGADLVGEKLTLLTFPLDQPAAPQEFPADQPFHVSHGWTVTSGPFQGPMADSTMPISTFDFQLLVDGEPAKNTGRWRLPSEEATDLSIHWVYNFDEGMTGVHTFTGLWYASCEWALTYTTYEPIPNTCLTADTLTELRAPVLVLTRTVEVTFTP